MDKKFFKIFKAGKYPQGVVTADDVNEIASTYNPEFHEAPLTILHDDSSPAYAAVAEVINDNGTLLASFTDILDEAYEMNKKYKRPSIEIAEYDGKKYLRAVTLTNFPQVKGLDKIKFDENSSVFFSEGLTINLTKGIKMSDVNFEEKYNTLQQQFNDLKALADADAAELKKFTDAGITPEKFAEVNTKLTEAQSQIQKFEKERIDSLISLASQTKDVLSSFSSLEAFENHVKNFAEKISFDEAKKFVDGLKAKPENKILPKVKPDGKEYTYQDILNDPSLKKNFSEEEITELRKKSKIFL